MFKFFNTLMILALIFVASGSASNVQAENPKPPAAVSLPSSETTQVLLLFSIPRIDPAGIPHWLSPEEATAYAVQLIGRQAAQLRPELQQLVETGQIAGYSVRPEQAGVLVQVNDPSVLGQLARLSGVQGVYPAAEAATCSASVAEALKQVLVSQAFRAPATALAPLSTNTTDPTIEVYHISGSNYGSIHGTTTPNTPVSLRILRGGVAVGSATDRSYSDGSYSFYPGSSGCGSSSDWDILDGDTVEVTAHGSVVSLLVVTISAWANPVTDTVGGVTAPFQTVRIDLINLNNPCASSTTSLTGTSGAGGEFEAPFGDFNRLAYVVIYVLDSNGNSTYTNARAFSFNNELGSDGIFFSWKAGETIHATLSRGGSVTTTWDWKLPAGTSYGLGLNSGDSLQAGDIINLSSAIGSMSYTMAPFSINVDPVADTISGVTYANRPVMAQVSWPYYGATCSGASGCLKTNANGAGAYLISNPIGPGDRVYSYVFDAEGNYQYGTSVYLPALVAEPQYNDVGITWPNSNNLTVTLKSSGGTVKQTIANAYSDPYNLYWWYFSSATMVAGDRIEVTDGVTTISMSVQNIAGRLNSSTGHLLGTSANGHLIAKLYDFRAALSGSNSYCQETQVTTGSFDLTFPGSQIGPQDSANLTLVGSDGYFTIYYANTFKVQLAKGGTNVWGYTDIPGSSVTISVWRGGVQLASNSQTSSPNSGYFDTSNNLSAIGSLQTGDTVQVATNEGNSANLVVPALSVSADPVADRLYGVAPSGQPVRLILFYNINLNNSWGWVVGNPVADGSGNYSLSTAGLATYNCNPIVAGSTCTGAEVDYYYPVKEHSVWTSINPAYVSADSYEDDNSYVNASAYMGVQLHTIHTSSDQDWVKFTVTQADVNAKRLFRLETFDIGPGMDTVLQLYGTNGTTLLASNDDYDNVRASRITWKPSAAGVYYARVLPFNSSYSQYCGAFYRLKIGVVYLAHLPIVRK